MTKAIVAKIDLGFTKLDGLMLPDSSYAIAVPQVVSLVQSNPEHASRDFKRLLGGRFNPSKKSIEGTKAQVNIINLETFTFLIRALDKNGNKIATALVDAFFEESIDRRFDTAFGKKVSEEERNQILALRVKRILARRAWTAVLQERHIQCYGTKPSSEQFKEWTVRVNQVLFAKKHFNCNRDNMEIEEQRIIEMFENMAIRRAGQNPKSDPNKLLELALDTF